MGSRRSGVCLRSCLVVFAIASALFVCGPALYWRFQKGIKFGSGEDNNSIDVSSSSSCSPCICDCPPPLSLINIVPDCGKNDPDLSKEMEKQFVDLLTEELKLQEAVAEEHTNHMNITNTEARRVASQYQKEAEKCNAATETCEGARERAEALLRKERKITYMWERRARQFGWEGE
ncbi:ubiquitin-associated protein [Thalictrum thalictroides]|uniref:Ubiquitin-associated protein n=1 Tax=Thalictrum thalictroides TaxID=46969 RepID=A0A7J6WJK6_THATH|nr:ubiquitin-associated protein [Thalictrum thalictroides]